MVSYNLSALVAKTSILDFSEIPVKPPLIKALKHPSSAWVDPDVSFVGVILALLCRWTRSWPQESSSCVKVWKRGRKWKQSRCEFFPLCDVFSVRSNVQICSRDKFFNLQIMYLQIATASSFNDWMGCFPHTFKSRSFFFFNQVKQAEVLSKKKEERNKHFIPPKEKPLMKKSTEGKDESVVGHKWCETTV